MLTLSFIYKLPRNSQNREIGMHYFQTGVYHRHFLIVLIKKKKTQNYVDLGFSLCFYFTRKCHYYITRKDSIREIR